MPCPGVHLSSLYGPVQTMPDFGLPTAPALSPFCSTNFLLTTEEDWFAVA
jgi:hypothetical protein